MVNITLKQWDKIGWKFENIYMSMYSMEILFLIGMSWYICIFKFFRPPCMIFDFAFERSLSALFQSVLLISLEKNSLIYCIFKLKWSVLYWPQYLLIDSINVICFHNPRLCQQLSSVIGLLGPSVVFGSKGVLLIFAFFLSMRPRAWGLDRSMAPDFMALASTMFH